MPLTVVVILWCVVSLNLHKYAKFHDTNELNLVWFYDYRHFSFNLITKGK